MSRLTKSQALRAYRNALAEISERERDLELMPPKDRERFNAMLDEVLALAADFGLSIDLSATPDHPDKELRGITARVYEHDPTNKMGQRTVYGNHIPHRS
jgi:hypothetical protein